jgi:uncharacterized protein YehS (DUF1456 family)
MNNNDILQRIHKILGLGSSEMTLIFGLADFQLKKSNIDNWLLDINETGYEKFGDHELTVFLNGLISYRRGKKEGSVPVKEGRITNNLILKKLKIAFELETDDLMEIMELADSPIRKLELSALFRKADNKHYRVCKDQVLDSFICGLELKYSSIK